MELSTVLSTVLISAVAVIISANGAQGLGSTAAMQPKIYNLKQKYFEEKEQIAAFLEKKNHCGVVMVDMLRVWGDVVLHCAPADDPGAQAQCEALVDHLLAFHDKYSTTLMCDKKAKFFEDNEGTSGVDLVKTMVPKYQQVCELKDALAKDKTKRRCAFILNDVIEASKKFNDMAQDPDSLSPHVRERLNVNLKSSVLDTLFLLEELAALHGDVCDYYIALEDKLKFLDIQIRSTTLGYYGDSSSLF